MFQLFQKTVTDLSTRYHTPNFIPHITLLGSITGQEKDLLAKLHHIAQTLKTFRVSFTDIGAEQFFFRSLYLKVNPYPKLLQANQKCQETFGTNIPFMPHLSLLYSNLTNKQKEPIIHQLRSRHWPNFIVNSLHFYKCDGEVKDWILVDKIPFNQI